MNTLAFLGPIGWPELLILAFLGLLIFGKRLPEVGKSAGQFIVSFKKGLKDTEREVEEAVDAEPKKLESDKAKTTTASTTKNESQATV
ncbi:MAG: twin-arginine translocase TatA/TatE family subunit [Phycisphaeraceae bacterium]